jgi:transcriptional regulator with GAF, ATPase, and Fis domain
MQSTFLLDDQHFYTTDIHRLIPALSTAMSHADNDLDAAIELALRGLAEALAVDCAALVEYDDNGGTTQTAGWAVVGSASALADAPWGRPTDADIVVVDQMPEEYARRSGLRAALLVHVTVGDRHRCALALGTIAESRAWSAPVIDALRLFAEIIAGAVRRRRQDVALRRLEEEMGRLRASAERETERPADDAAAPEYEGIIGRSVTLRTSLARLREVSPTNSSVLLLGETGTGKELFARAIHNAGPRHAQPLVVVNCAALPATLIESELFGHTRGAFTGAVTTRQGRFELAHRGTLFLDEIGDLPLDLQTKLLRVLQEGTFERLGSSQTLKVDVRIIAATHRDLIKAVAAREFREDLYYRLSVFPIRVPSLRDRRADIPELVWFIIHRRQRAMQRTIRRVPDGVMQALQQYDWPGNVRELENVIERSLIHSTGDTLYLLDDPLSPVAAAPDAEADGTLSAVERMHISDVLNACGGRINGSGNAAERLGVHPNTLRFRMKKLGIVRGAHGSRDLEAQGAGGCSNRRAAPVTRH